MNYIAYLIFLILLYYFLLRPWFLYFRQYWFFRKIKVSDPDIYRTIESIQSEIDSLNNRIYSSDCDNCNYPMEIVSPDYSRINFLKWQIDMLKLIHLNFRRGSLDIPKDTAIRVILSFNEYSIPRDLDIITIDSIQKKLLFPFPKYRRSLPSNLISTVPVAR